MKPISNEKRELIIAAKQRGEREKDIAKWLNISKDSVGTIWRLFRKTGSILPMGYKGRVSVITQEKTEEIQTEVKNNPDITLSEIIEKLSLPIQKSQLSRLLISLGYSFKKRQHIPPHKTTEINFVNIYSNHISKADEPKRKTTFLVD